MSFQEAIQDKYGFMPGLTTVDGKIRDWPYKNKPLPTATEIRKLKGEGTKAALKKEVKLLASKKILREVPMWQQMNLAARMVTLKHKGGARTDEEKAEMAEIKSQWAFIDSVRKYSNALEAAVDASPKTDINKGWPKRG